MKQILADFGTKQSAHSALTNLPKGTKAPDDFFNIYRFLVKELGQRNEALFRVGCQMRDAGYRLDDCIETLADLHAAQAAVGKHASETEAQRWAEAERSLRSVFTKPARQQHGEGLYKEDSSYLPNNLREAILAQSDGTAFLRVYEALLLLGLKAGEWLTEGEIKVRLSSYGMGADPIELPDIRTVKHYRAALNRELIARRPAKYSQFWLGKRLNVSTKSIQRYLKLSKVHSCYSFHETQIDWGNVNTIPSAYAAKRAGFDVRPYFLQDKQGKRYPAMASIAQKLLQAGHGVWLMRRDCKHYWIDEEKPALSLEERFTPKNLEVGFSFPYIPHRYFCQREPQNPLRLKPFQSLKNNYCTQRLSLL